MSSTELKPIVLYDIPCITPGRPWSPNTMKTRYCLVYKRLPFTTVWVELPDIAGLLQSKGITHPPYTLPAIEDPNTGAFTMDSLAIAAYLDETYPETPSVLSPAARAGLEGARDMFSFGSGGAPGANPRAGALPGGGVDLAPRLVFLILAGERLNPVSKAYYHRTCAARLGERWTTLRDACSASPEDRAERVRQGIVAIRETWRKITMLYGEEGEGDPGRPAGETSTSGRPFALGEEPCLLDFAVAGRIKFVLNAGLTPSEVETLTNLEGGRLGRLVESLEKYYKY
ncbi:hypothetical protein HD554DRAFT_2145587 [Boletus coccyginus]|nr:hypothetical protein HD554DRAFT_2145587 [Boletus coccyginus]